MERTEGKSRLWPRSRNPSVKGTSLPRDARPVIRPEMVRRLDIAPHLIDPMGSQAPTFPSERMAESTGIDTLSRAASRRSLRSSVVAPPPTTEDDFGGFPGPEQLLSRILSKLSPRFKHRLKRTLTVPRTETLIPRSGGAVIAPDGPVKPVPYLSFSAVVRNSTFHGLTEENIEELGGVEYRALSALLWVIPLVCKSSASWFLGMLTCRRPNSTILDYCPSRSSSLLHTCHCLGGRRTIYHHYSTRRSIQCGKCAQGVPCGLR